MTYTDKWVSDDGSVTLYCGDCLAILPTLEAGSVDSVIVDPPYGVSYQSAWRTDKADWKPVLANDDSPFIWWLPQAARITKDAGCLFCFCRWDVQEGFRHAIEWAGYKIKSQIVWDREWHGMGDLKAAFAPCHDVAWFATTSGYQFPGKRPLCVLRSKRVAAEDLAHPTEKPVELMEEIVKSTTSPNGLVMDNCMGSGTTGVAAVRLGRKFIGIEIEPKYFEIAKRRIQAELNAYPLLEGKV